MLIIHHRFRPRYRPQPRYRRRPHPTPRPPVTVRRMNGTARVLTPANLAWKSVWPVVPSSIIGCAMLQCAFITGALEIGSLVKSTDTDLYGKTSSTGAGLWCGFIFFLGAVMIFIANLMHRIQVGATLAFFTNMIAASFAYVLIGLDGNTVADRAYAISYSGKIKTLAAQLAVAGLELLLCVAFMIMYIIVAIRAFIRLRRVRSGAV